MIQEGVRAYYGTGGWYHDVATALPHVENGFVSAPDAPGLGISLRPEFLSRPEVRSTSSTT